MQALIQTSASALGSQQRISSFKGFGRGQTETFRAQIVFLFYLFFLFFIFTFFPSEVIELTFLQEANQA